MAAMQQRRQSVKKPFGLPKAREEERIAAFKFLV